MKNHLTVFEGNKYLYEIDEEDEMIESSAIAISPNYQDIFEGLALRIYTEFNYKN